MIDEDEDGLFMLESLLCMRCVLRNKAKGNERMAHNREILRLKGKIDKYKKEHLLYTEKEGYCGA